MQKKIVKQYVSHMFGFPVHILNAPMRKVMGDWALDINLNLLEQWVLQALILKPVALSGSEVRFIRLHFNMTLKDFGKRFDVSHVAVMKWEGKEKQATKMNWTTEKDLRLFVFTQLSLAPKDFLKIYQELEKKPVSSTRYQPFELQADLAS